MREYFLFTEPTDSKVAVVKTLNDAIRRYYYLTDAVSVVQWFPPDATIALSPSSGDWVTDFVANIHKVAIISQKVRVILEAEGIRAPEMEFLPVRLKDRRGEPMDAIGPFYVANTTRKVECFDWDKSVYALMEDDDDDDDRRPRDDGDNSKKTLLYAGMQKLVLRNEAIPSDARFFRLAEQTQRLIIRSDLVDRLKAEGCTGLFLTKMGDPLL